MTDETLTKKKAKPPQTHEFDKQKKWVENWMSHPEYKRRLKNTMIKNVYQGDPIPTDDEVSNTIQTSLSKMRSTPIYTSRPLDRNGAPIKSEVSEGNLIKNPTIPKNAAGAYYEFKNPFIQLRVEGKTPEELKGVATHELMHSTGVFDKAMPRRLNYNDDSWTEDIHSDARMQKFRTLKYMNRNETYSHMQGLRAISDIKPGEVITKERLNSIRDEFKTNANVTRLFEVYDEDEVLNMLNTVAQKRENTAVKGRNSIGGLLYKKNIT